MKRNKIKRFSISRHVTFNGRRRVGLDTNILRKIYEQPYLLELEASKIFNKKDLLFTHSVCLHEFTNYLSSRKGLSYDKAKNEAKEFIKSRNVWIIYHKECPITTTESEAFEEESNKKLTGMGKEYLNCHKPDSIILLALKKKGINRVISTDETVRICARFLGMDGSNIPSFDVAVDRELKKNHKFYKKFYKKK